jgi:hypothetical protein
MRLQTFARLFVGLAAAITLPACELVGDIFQAGMAVGIFLVLLFVGVVAFLISKARRHV